MRIVVCLDSPDAAALVAAVLATIRLEHAELVLLHVRDLEPRRLIDLVRDRPGRPPLPPERRAELEAAEYERARRLFAEARAVLAAQALGVSAREVVLSGRPEQEIVAFLRRERADLAVLRGRFGAPAGPASIGHVARFVLDHAGCSVLLVR